jgi:redox-sensitive bicupin YhaK (pirin superfamily)
VKIQQDASLYAGILQPGTRIDHQIAEGRFAWVQVARGSLKLNDLELNQGDGAAIKEESVLKLVAGDEAEVLLFDLA